MALRLGLGLRLGTPALIKGGGGAPVDPLVDYFATDGGTSPWYSATRETGIYDATSNKTFLTWERWSGIQRVCQVDCYDHATDTWLPSAQAGTSIIRNDDHGVPAIVMSPNGYLFTFFGPHSNNMRVRASANPRDHSSWVTLADISSQALTYPHPVFSGNTLHLFARQEVGVQNKMPLVLFTAPNVTANAAAFGAVQTLVDFGTDSRNYIGTVQMGPDGWIWIAGCRANFGDNYRRDVFIWRYNPANGDIANVDGSVVIPLASRPISLATSEASFRIVTTNPTGTGSIPHFCWDTAGNFHVVYGDGPSATEVKSFHIMWNGTSWTSPFEVMNQKNRYATVSIAPFGTGVEFVGSVSVDGTGRGVDIYRTTRSAAGAFSGPTLVQAGGDYGIDVPNPILNAQSDLRWMWAEVSGGGSGSNTSVSDDEFAGYQRVFAWGDGYKRRDPDPQLSLSRTTIKAGLAVGDFVAQVQSRQPRETLTLNDPSGKFSLSGRKIVVASALSAGSYPITITSSFRGLTKSLSATLTVQAAVDVSDKALFRLDFDEGSGQSILDKSGNGISGFLGTSASDTTSDLSRVSTGLENSTAGQLNATIPYKPVMNEAANIHVFMPIRLLVSTGGGTILARRNGFTSEQVFIFDVTNGRLRWWQYNALGSSVQALNPTATLAVNQWALVEAEVNGATVTLRQDGVDVFQTTLSTAMNPTNEAPLNISAYVGTSGSIGAGFRGSIGCVHAYPRVLSSGEAAEARTLIKSIMSGRGVTLP